MEVLRRKKDGEKSKKEKQQEKEKELLQHGEQSVTERDTRSSLQQDHSLEQLLKQQHRNWEKDKLEAEKDAKVERPTLHTIELPNLKPVAFGVWRALHELSYPLPQDLKEDLVDSGIPENIQEKFKVGYIEDVMEAVQNIATRFKPEEIQLAGIPLLKDYTEKKVPFLVFPYLRDDEICFISCRALLSREERHELGVKRFVRLGEKIPFPYNSMTFETILERERKKVFFLYPSRYRLNILSKEEDVLVVEEKGFSAIAIRDFYIEPEWYKLFAKVEPVLIVDQSDREYPEWEQRAKRLKEEFASHKMVMRLENLPDSVFVPDWFVKSNLGARTFKSTRGK